MHAARQAQADDEEALADEGAEALRLQRQAAEALRPEDFGVDGAEEGTTDEDEGVAEGAAETLGQAAARVWDVMLDAVVPGWLMCSGSSACLRSQRTA